VKRQGKGVVCLRFLSATTGLAATTDFLASTLGAARDREERDRRETGVRGETRTLDGDWI
jgi:hypothetical protein